MKSGWSSSLYLFLFCFIPNQEVCSQLDEHSGFPVTSNAKMSPSSSNSQVTPIRRNCSIVVNLWSCLIYDLKNSEFRYFCTLYLEFLNSRFLFWPPRSFDYCVIISDILKLPFIVVQTIKIQFNASRFPIASHLESQSVDKHLETAVVLPATTLDCSRLTQDYWNAPWLT